MTFGSLFTGAGGGDIGLDRAGLSCRWQCEIDRQCRSVLARHWPDVERYDDITTMRKPAKVDVVIGGSPCQGFSVAGARGGVGDERSGLFSEMVRVVAEVKPKYVIWENVPGVLSGYDEVLADESYELFSWAERRALAVDAGGLIRRWWMGAVVRSFADIGYGGAYRVLDGRYFGVPQRRRRVFAVFVRESRGDSGTRRAAEILALGQSLPRHPAKGRKAGQDVAGTLGGGSPGRGWSDDTDRMTFLPTTSPTRSAKWAKGSGGPAGDECQNLIAHTLRAEGHDASEDGTGRGTPLVAFQCQGINVGAMGVVRKGSGSVTGGVPFFAFAQNQRDEIREMEHVGALAAEPGMKQQTYVAFSAKDHGGDSGELAPTLRAMGHKGSHANAGGQVAIAFQERRRPQGKAVEWSEGLAYACTAMNGGGHKDKDKGNVATPNAVRRLTPRECERLMSWPDDHTRWAAGGKELADGPRYRMIGNGMVSNCIEWLGRRAKLN